jgi:hypothetical protein
MAYQINLNNVKRTITNSILNKLELYRHNLYEWIIETNDITDIFIDTFYQFFFHFMDDSIEDDLRLMSSNTTNMFIAYLDSHTEYDIDTIKIFIRKYIELILTTEGCWSEELKMNMEEFNESQYD